MKRTKKSPLKLIRQAATTIALPSLMVATSQSEETALPDDLPEAVVQALNEAAPDFVADEIEIEEDDGRLVYEFEGLIEDREVEIEIAEDGEVLEMEFEDEDSDEDDEDDIAVSDLPESVLAAAQDAVPGLQITEAEKESTQDGDTYEIEGTVDGKEVEITIAEDGSVLEIEMDSDGDELSDDDEAENGTDPLDPDTDDDTYPDGFESKNGGDPTNSEIVPGILALNVADDQPDKEVVLSIATFKGKKFTLEHCPDGRNWNELGVDIDGDGLTHDIRIAVKDTADCGFFRVRIRD